MFSAFEAVAVRRPDAIAVVDDDREIRYGELLARANAVAGWLHTLPRRPEPRVVLLAERSVAAVAAMLGAIRAGVAFVPIEPPFPDERLRRVLDEAAPAAILVSRAALWPAPLAGELPATPVVELSALPPVEAAAPPAPPPAGAACVLYTSGSTGRPKGVVLTRGALAWYSEVYRDLTGLTAADRVLQFASLTFDVALEEVFATLAAGATLVLRPPGAIEALPGFVARLGRHAITVLHAPTAFWHEWMKEVPAPGTLPPASLRLLVVGGEAASRDAYDTWRVHVRLPWINTYGPTEATVSATAFAVAAGEPIERAVPIGHPLPGVEAHVLDGSLAPVPPGTPGELYLGGAGLARGYLGSARATAERFVPGGARPGERIYRTGDEVVRGDDGVLHYRGRLDRQVKLRGFRIELDEIELALAAALPGAQVAVVLRSDAGRPPQLVAYLVPRARRPVDLAALRDALARQLPAYMVPAFVVLERFPLGRSGKLDRAALPAPGSDAGPAPESPLEALVLDLVRGLLGRPVGIDDDFFVAGGSSLELMRLQARLTAACGVELPFEDVFALRTARALAAMIERAQLAAVDADELATLTRSIEALSDHEAAALLAGATAVTDRGDREGT